MNVHEEAWRARDSRKMPDEPGPPKESPGQPVDDRHKGIRCPRCRWRPRKSDIWGCTCGHVWNTFETGGCCPQCGYKWPVTQCLECKQYSPHEDWYGD